MESSAPTKLDTFGIVSVVDNGSLKINPFPVNFCVDNGFVPNLVNIRHSYTFGLLPYRKSISDNLEFLLIEKGKNKWHLPSGYRDYNRNNNDNNNESIGYDTAIQFGVHTGLKKDEICSVKTEYPFVHHYYDVWQREKTHKNKRENEEKDNNQENEYNYGVCKNWNTIFVAEIKHTAKINKTLNVDHGPKWCSFNTAIKLVSNDNNAQSKFIKHVIENVYQCMNGKINEKNIVYYVKEKTPDVIKEYKIGQKQFEQHWLNYQFGFNVCIEDIINHRKKLNDCIETHINAKEMQYILKPISTKCNNRINLAFDLIERSFWCVTHSARGQNKKNKKTVIMKNIVSKYNQLNLECARYVVKNKEKIISYFNNNNNNLCLKDFLIDYKSKSNCKNNSEIMAMDMFRNTLFLIGTVHDIGYYFDTDRYGDKKISCVKLMQRYLKFELLDLSIQVNGNTLYHIGASLEMDTFINQSDKDYLEALFGSRQCDWSILTNSKSQV